MVWSNDVVFILKGVNSLVQLHRVNGANRNLKLLYLIFPAGPPTWPTVQEKQRLFCLGIEHI